MSALAAAASGSTTGWAIGYTIGIVVVGICSAVLVYVTIVALQAFYMDDTSEIQMMADYGGQDTTAKTIKAEQMGAINRTSSPNPAPK